MHKKDGFMMMEVLIAIFILMLTTVNIINIQFRALYRAADDKDEIMHLFKLKKELYNLLLFPEKKTFKKKTEAEVEKEKPINIFLEQHSLEKKSSLSSLASQLQLVTVEGRWDFRGTKRSTRLAGIVYNPTEDKKGV